MSKNCCCQVTLIGHSAGGMSTLYHLLSPPSWPYFHRAVSMSAAPLNFFMANWEESQHYHTYQANRLGCNQVFYICHLPFQIN